MSGPALKTWMLPAALVALALLAVGGAFATTSGRPDGPASSTLTDDSGRAAALTGTYAIENGPDGSGWRWLKPSATLAISGPGRRWVAFRARANKTPRALRLQPDTGRARTVRVLAARDKVFLVGPLVVDARTRIALRASAGPTQGNRGDDRSLSVFLSAPVIADRPIAVVPGRGFFHPERDTEGNQFRWMGSRGHADVVLGEPRTGELTLSLLAGSVDSVNRRLVVRSGGASDSVQVETSRPERVTVGPFPIRDGRARVLLTASPRGTTHPGDLRRIAIQVADLRATVR